MSNQKDNTVYETMYNYRYMLETGYTFDEYAQTVAHEIDKKIENKEETN
jgi:hypothetical protein